jgi:hypothetical protein
LGDARGIDLAAPTACTGGHRSMAAIDQEHPMPSPEISKPLDPGPTQGIPGPITQNEEHYEGKVAKAIEKQTAKLPSDIFLWAAIGSMVASATLALVGGKQTKEVANFVGQWAPTLLILGLYNKLVKVAGSDKSELYGPM